MITNMPSDDVARTKGGILELYRNSVAAHLITSQCRYNEQQVRAHTGTHTNSLRE